MDRLNKTEKQRGALHTYTPREINRQTDKQNCVPLRQRAGKIEDTYIYLFICLNHFLQCNQQLTEQNHLLFFSVQTEGVA